MTAEIIQPPTNWTLSLQQQWGYGAATLASVHNATHCVASADTFALVANNGPKGGAVWNLTLALDPLTTGMILQQPFLTSEPITLGGNSSESLAVTYMVAWSIKDSQGIFKALAEGKGSLDVHMDYHRHRLWRGETSSTNHVSVQTVEVWKSLQKSATALNISLAAVAARAPVDAALQEAFASFGLEPSERQALHDVTWLAIQNPEEQLTYKITGDDGAAHLEFYPSWTGNIITADQRIATLSEIERRHSAELEKARRDVEKIREQLGCD